MRSRRRVTPTLKLRQGVPIGYKDLETLEKCLGSQGQILARKRTGLSAQRQRELKRAIKRARHLALMPFVG
ncbi:MAG: 30S ribosomal protein S18 [Planctomycetota bacterium]|nr:30S ribosomal protein S18 [Planctomycetota bacterium]